MSALQMISVQLCLQCLILPPAVGTFVYIAPGMDLRQARRTNLLIQRDCLGLHVGSLQCIVISNSIVQCIVMPYMVTRKFIEI